jgi:hypothetical protein
MDTLIQAVLIGTGATVVMDAWGIARRRLFGIPNMNYGLVGRWVAYLPRGRFRHAPIAKTPPVRGELAIGWIAHYAIGIGFAGVLLALWGLEWARQPTLGPALLVGIGTVAAPFLVMQPGMGAGIAASRAPRPNAARLQSLVTHAVFGFGMFVAAVLLNLVKG